MIFPDQIIQLPSGHLQCSVCQATAPLKDRSRFLRRHPGPCSRARKERRDFAKQLAQGTRCVDGEGFGIGRASRSDLKSVEISDMLVEVGASPRLSVWEREFVESVREQWAERASLSPRQKEVLSKIWGKRR